MARQFTIQQVVHRYLLATAARDLGQHTIDDYTHTFRRLVKLIAADTPVNAITAGASKRIAHRSLTSPARHC